MKFMHDNSVMERLDIKKEMFQYKLGFSNAHSIDVHSHGDNYTQLFLLLLTVHSLHLLKDNPY